MPRFIAVLGILERGTFANKLKCKKKKTRNRSRVVEFLFYVENKQQIMTNNEKAQNSAWIRNKL